MNNNLHVLDINWYQELKNSNIHESSENCKNKYEAFIDTHIPYKILRFCEQGIDQ